MKIRQANEGDIEAIANFQIAMAWETEHRELERDIIFEGVRNVFSDPHRGFYLVAESDQKIIASLLVTFEWSDWRNCNIWYLQSVYVEKPSRGCGVFRQMYNCVVERAQVAGSHVLRLYVETDNEAAQKAYDSVGMKRLPYWMYEAHLAPNSNQKKSNSSSNFEPRRK
jgi:GNAT superfamily N-acetyltransferase